MNQIKLFFLGVLCVSAMGCDSFIEIQNGKVPEQYVPLFSEVVGTYSASSEGRAFDLKINLESNNTVTVETTGDVLDPVCQSRVLELSDISLYRKKLDIALFQFDPGHCGNYVNGRAFRAAFGYTSTNQLGFNYRILKNYQSERYCYWRRGPYGIPYEYCTTRWRAVYHHGLAIKQGAAVSNTLKAFLLPLDTPDTLEDEVTTEISERDFRGRR